MLFNFQLNRIAASWTAPLWNGNTGRTSTNRERVGFDVSLFRLTLFVFNDFIDDSTRGGWQFIRWETYSKQDLRKPSSAQQMLQLWSERRDLDGLVQVRSLQATATSFEQSPLKGLASFQPVGLV